MSNNFIVKQQFLDEQLSAYHLSDNDIKKYFEDSFIISEKQLQSASIFKNEAPELKLNNEISFGRILGFNRQENHSDTDLENCIKLYESMDLNRVQASDERLWAYLCHVPYYSYVKNRYKPQRDMKILELDKYYEYDDPDKKTLRNYIKNRFFTTSDNRSLGRNGIAFLWWAAELTRSPWEKYEGIPKDNKDDYHYTKIIINEPDIYSSTFERTIGKEQNIIFPLLDVIKTNDLGRKAYRELIKKINSEAHLLNFSVLNYSEIIKLMEKLIEK